jgi:hypothetical protein
LINEFYAIIEKDNQLNPWQTQQSDT